MNPKHLNNKPKRQLLQQLFLVPLVIVGIYACNPSVDDVPVYPPATKIVRIEQFPDTLIEGDTLFIRCIVEDSLDNNLRFNWQLGDERKLSVNGRIDSSVIRWNVGNFDFFGNKPDSVSIASTRGGVIVRKIDSVNQFSEVDFGFNIYIKRKI